MRMTLSVGLVVGATPAMAWPSTPAKPTERRRSTAGDAEDEEGLLTERAFYASPEEGEAQSEALQWIAEVRAFFRKSPC